MNYKRLLIHVLLKLFVTLSVVKLAKSYECGIANSRAGKIVGGREAKVQEFPWQVSLKKHRSHSCGGTLIHPKWIVTAAHCLLTNFRDGGDFEHYTVEAGIHQLYLANHHKQTRKIKRVVQHPKFILEQIRNDIALIEVDEPFKIDESEGFINTACLPEDAFKISSGTVTVSGWGKLKEENGSFNDLLQGMTIPVVLDSTCDSLYKKLWSKIPGLGLDPDTMFCAGLESGGKDACQGDSGGPAVRRIDGKMHLVGVVSFGYGCARPGNPGIYTEVPHYVSWIQSVIQPDMQST